MKYRVATICVTLFGLVGCSGTDVQQTPTRQGEGPVTGVGVNSVESNFEPNSPEYFQALIGNTIYFDVDQSSISDQSIEVLRKQAEWLNRNPEFSVTIEGHADERGTREYNLALGARRADSVMTQLVSLGVLNTRLNTVTYGKERPQSVCSQESCWSKNRRSVSVLSGGFGG